jgi:hypothetical protein
MPRIATNKTEITLLLSLSPNMSRKTRWR